MDEKWTRLQSRHAGDFAIFSVRLDRSVSPSTGFQREFTVMETVDWVNVIARTDAGEILLVRQFRHGTREYTLEIPGGGVDARDSSPEEAARRELREETGYEARSWVPLGVVEPNPAFQTNRCHTYLAEGASPSSKMSLDPGEEIEVILRPESEVLKMMEGGEIAHALVVAAFYWYGIHRAGRI